MEELNQAMIEAEIKKETKDAIIKSTIKKCNKLRSSNSTRNYKAYRDWETIRSIKKRRNNKTNNSRGSQRKCKNSRERLIKEMEVKGQELELQEKRMILDAIQGGVDSVLKFGFLKKKGGK